MQHDSPDKAQAFNALGSCQVSVLTAASITWVIEEVLCRLLQTSMPAYPFHATATGVQWLAWILLEVPIPPPAVSAPAAMMCCTPMTWGALVGLSWQDLTAVTIHCFVLCCK